MTHAGTSQRVPFDLLIADWIGVGIIFLPDGSYYSHVPSRVTLHEEEGGNGRFLKYYNNSGKAAPVKSPIETIPDPTKKPDLFHDLFNEVVDSICSCEYHMRFEVDGKTVRAVEKSPSIVSAVGFMSTNDNYSFIIRDKFTHAGKDHILTLHNNHYFSSSNTRHVFGTISDPLGHTILLTSFTYTSYTPVHTD